MNPTVATGSVVLPVMLHARPAAVLAREAGAHRAALTVNGADAASVLSLMRLGAVAGQELQVVATGHGAGEALAAMVAAIAGLGAGGTVGGS